MELSLVEPKPPEESQVLTPINFKSSQLLTDHVALTCTKHEKKKPMLLSNSYDNVVALVEKKK